MIFNFIFENQKTITKNQKSKTKPPKKSRNHEHQENHGADK